MMPPRTENPSRVRSALRAAARSCSSAPVVSWLPVALLACGCNISPQPVPPPEEMQPISIRAELITMKDDGQGAVILIGAPGAVQPSAELIRGVNRLQGLPAIAPVEADGSFAVTIPGMATESFRVQAREGLVFSPPLDIQGTGATGPVVEVAPPYGGCVSLDPPLEIAFAPTPAGHVELEPVRVLNQCPFEVMVAGTTLVDAAVFEPMAGMSAGLIPTGGEALLGVAFKPLAEGLFEDFLLVDFMTQPDPPPDPALLPRWVVSVRGVAVAKP